MNSNLSQPTIPKSQNRFSRELLKISDHQLGTKFRSKIDIYQYLTETLHCYMPPIDFITKDFLKQILRNEKELINMEELKLIKVPRYPELSVKTIYPQVMDDENLRKYFPDIDTHKKFMDREYFFNILNTIYPDYVKAIIEHAQNSRNAPEQNEIKKNYILISDDWYEKLMSHPFISKRPGKTIQLLKESTKILKGRKQRQNQDLGISLKRFKGMSNQQISLDNVRSTQDKIPITQLFEEEEENEDGEITSLSRKRMFNI